MRFSFRSSLLLIAALGPANVTLTQTSSHSAQTRKAPPSKLYCQPDGSFCFKYPGSWSVQGVVFDGNGVVVAPPQKEDRALWNAITIALVVPSPKDDEKPVGLDGVIERATVGLREGGQAFETLQRQRRTIDHKPAQMLKVRYHEKANDHDWIEEMIFIEGPDNEIYSVALKCSPPDLARLEPVFSQVLASWTLPEPEPPADHRAEEAPRKSAPPKKVTPNSSH